MKRNHGRYVIPALALAALLAGCWGSDKSTSLEVGVATQPARVGSAQCTNTCHAASVDITGNPIAATWAASTHYTVAGVECEDCHGGGGNHFGLGPIPYPNPQAAQCNACHGFTNFAATAHGNPNALPGGSYFQQAVGDGSGQADLFGVPIRKADNVTIVTKGEHIEECSRCHNANQRFAYTVGPSGKALLDPDPSALPAPVVSCASCHDAHQPQSRTPFAVVTRGTVVGYPNFRKFVVDDNPLSPTFGAQADGGVGFVATIFQPNGSVALSGTPDYSRVVGGNNEINPERLCASCHARGVYKYAKFNANNQDVSPTHQGDVFAQYRNSGHGDRTAAAFGEFSANPAYYNPSYDNSHRISYPYDMAKSATPAVPANTTRNAEGSFACMKCHHGIGSLAFQDNVEGTSAAPVLFGDTTVTCITCHSPHEDAAGNTKNTRKPVVMSKYSGGGLTFSGNVFLDNTPVPSEAGNETICIFCHQGRESGFALFKRRIATGTTVTGNFLNPHYLGTGAMLWARNGYEYTDNTSGTAVPKQYGYITAHQQTNCNGCHMAASSTSGLGGHTWKILSDDESVVNNASCNVSSCHNGRVPATNSAGEFHDFRDSVLSPTADYDLDGTVEGTAKEIAGVENLLIALLDNNGITYSDQNYPYFFRKGTTSAHTAWNRAQLKAAFNIQYVIKGLPSAAVSQIGQPNTTAATHNYRYILQLLMDSYEFLYNNTASPSGSLPTPAALLANRPAGVRAATNYNPQSGGGYDPLQ
jgi:hypothetical protein